MVAIIDYDAGNIKSVEKAVAFLGKEAVITRKPEEILGADHVILPGVGNFGDAMKKLEKYGLIPVIREVIEKQIPLQVKDLVEYQKGQVVSKTLVQNEQVSMTIFSFDKDEEISTHAAGGDAMVTVLEGTGKFTVGGEVFILHEGETLIMPKDVPHAVYGKEQFKMQLIVSF